MPTTNINPLRIFISYSHTNQQEIEELERIISKAGIEYFLDVNDMEFGDDIVARVRTEIKNCTHFLIYISPASRKSEWVWCEIGMALGFQRIIIPYLGDPAIDIPKVLKNLNYISTPSGFNVFLQQLKSSTNDTLFGRMSPVERKAKDVLYYYHGGYARAIRLFCADDEYISESRVEIHYTHENLVSPPDLSESKKRAVERKKQEAEQRNALFFNGPNARLLRWRANPKGQADLATEQNTLELELGPVGWYDFVGLNEALRETVPDADIESVYSYYIGLEKLIKDGDVSSVKLSNILDTATTILSCDGYAAYQERGQRVASVPGLLTSAVAENINRYLDDTVPSDSTKLINIDHFSEEKGFSLDENYRPQGVPHPFAAVRRGIIEELSPDILSHMRPKSIKLTGLSFDLEALHPNILFTACVDLSKNEILDACSKNPGKDWQEGKIHFVRADFGDKETLTVLEQKWVPAGKASFVRAITLLNALQRKMQKDFKAVFELIATSN